MGAPPIHHHLPIRVNDSLISSEISQTEQGVMNKGPHENPLKVRKVKPT